MRVIVKSTLRKFWEQPAYRDAQGPLESWYEEAIKANWSYPQAVKSKYGNASICNNNRVIFNIGGNKYRLVIEMQYPFVDGCRLKFSEPIKLETTAILTQGAIIELHKPATVLYLRKLPSTF